MNCTVSTKKSMSRLAIATAAWLLSTAMATFGSMLLWPDQQLVKILVLLLNLVLGGVMIEVNRRYVLALDELQQKIYLQASAISLGVAVIGGITYSLADTTNVIPFDAEISVLIMLVGITYLVSMIIATRRYQ